MTTAVYSDGSREKVEINVIYTSSDPSIAEISTSGVITAISEGTVLIKAEYDGLVATYELQTLTPKQIEMEGVNQGMDSEATLPFTASAFAGTGERWMANRMPHPTAFVTEQDMRLY